MLIPWRHAASVLWRYKGFVWHQWWHEFRARYQGTGLGALWHVLQPLTLLMVYALVFSELMASRMKLGEQSISYTPYLCVGLLAWNYWSEGLSRGTRMYVEMAPMLKKIRFPRLLMPVLVLGQGTLQFGLFALLLLVYLAISGGWPGWALLWLPVLWGIMTVLLMGASSVLSVLHVFSRDVGQMVGSALQWWFWLTPVVYPITVLPPMARELMALNPMFHVLQAFHAVFLAHRAPDPIHLLVPLMLGLCLLAYGGWLTRRQMRDMLDAL
ncbi:MAG: Integral rane component of ABC-transporter [Pseudomonadota bacterium]|jgi:lipopolysaccharide transport system permease protein